MKQLILIILLLGIGIFGYFQYQNYKKFNPPSDYGYNIDQRIDANYHDVLLVQTYYENAYKLESLARELWYNEGIDILNPDNEVQDSRNRIAYYNQLQAATKVIEGKLLYSASLKEQGFSNHQVKTIEREGVSPQFIALKENAQILGVELGHEGSAVWELQKILRKNGYEMPQDGVFQQETETGLKAFQLKNGLFTSGKVDLKTLKALTK